jgi:hypothetical protein
MQREPAGNEVHTRCLKMVSEFHDRDIATYVWVLLLSRARKDALQDPLLFFVAG